MGNNKFGGINMYAYATSFNKINFVIDSNQYFEIISLKICNGTNFLSIQDYNINDKTMEILLKEEFDIKSECVILYKNTTLQVNYFPLYQSDDFNKRFYYGDELGLLYSKECSSFKVWSPVSSSIILLLYKNGDPDISEEPRRFKMEEQNGVFSITINEDLKGYFYEYEVHVFNNKNIAIDPYSKAVGINGLRAAIIDLKDTDPENWDKDIRHNIKSYTDAIIYETSIRDISIHPDSGIQNKGKFLGLKENNTKSTKNVFTGLSHIKEMGITHVQLMPFFDFSYKSVDERDSIKYNWGYDPQNYNTPEGSYSVDAYSPISRVKELKEMIFELHKNGISVNMDVVYNHVFNEHENNFEKIFPGYYLRRNIDGSFCNGSGCGNDTASEQKMMKKFMLESIMFWAVEYHIDGFRFDLMGLHDLDTMNQIKESLDNLGLNIMVYGEGWDLNTAIPYSNKAIKANAKNTPKIGYFNDYIRDVVKGHVFELDSRGFVSGKDSLEGALRYVILGTKGDFLSPEQSINFASCHDNATLWDKFECSNKEYSIEDRIKMVKLSNAIILTSQGVPFLHSGEEFLRTKLGEHNSFKSPDNVNSLNWDRKNIYSDVVEYYKGLIRIRRSHPAFRMSNYTDIEKNIEFLQGLPQNVVGYIIKNNANGDSWKEILVIFNSNKDSTWITLPKRQWYLVADDVVAGVAPIKVIDSPKINISGISMYLAFTI